MSIGSPRAKWHEDGIWIVAANFGKDAAVVNALNRKPRQGMKDKNASVRDSEKPDITKRKITGAGAGEVGLMAHDIGVSNRVSQGGEIGGWGGYRIVRQD